MADRLGRPRWLYQAHARLCGYFWMPCPVCGRSFSGWEWKSKNTVHPNGLVGRGYGVCSQNCVRQAAALNDDDDRG